jgi:glycolate oxidase FAD binding subunit
VGVTSPSRPDVEAALAAVVGSAHVRGGDAADAFVIDGRRPRWAVFPGSVGEVARCLAIAHAERLAVAPVGAGTRLGWGAPPRALDLVLSLARLDRIVAHEPADLTASVEAGVPLERLNAVLVPHRQRLPLDPARADRSTIGGLIATGASGPYRARYGTMRELMLGVTVVRADGTVVQGGGRVVKNATGYDMPKLHVGALGTLGVIVGVHLRLHPVPAREATWCVALPSVEVALDAALALLDAPLVCGRIQLLDGGALRRLGHAGLDAALAVMVGSVPEAVAAQGGRIEEVCRRSGGRQVAVAAPDAWWRAVSDAAGPADLERSLALRIGTRSTDVAKALRAVEAAVGAAGLVRATAEVANGVLHVLLETDAVGELPGRLERIREGLAALDGTCVVEHAPATLKPSLDVWGEVGPALGLMRTLKGELDPRHILNPGRYVGGI